jgi:hypothetical protein
VDPERWDLPEWMEAELDVLEEIDERLRPRPSSLYLGEASYDDLFMHAAIIDMARCLSLAGRTQAYHVYAPGRRFREALGEAQVVAFRIVSEELGFRPPHQDAQLEPEVRRLDRLSLSDIARVREESEFVALRRDLGAALDRVLADPNLDDPDWSREAQRQLAAELEERREIVRKEIFKSQVLRRASRRATREFALAFGSVGSVVNVTQHLLESGSLEAAMVKGLVGGAVAGALTALGILVAEYRREQRLPEGAPRNPGKVAAYHQLCVLSPPDEIISRGVV